MDQEGPEAAVACLSSYASSSSCPSSHLTLPHSSLPLPVFALQKFQGPVQQLAALECELKTATDGVQKTLNEALRSEQGLGREGQMEGRKKTHHFLPSPTTLLACSELDARMKDIADLKGQLAEQSREAERSQSLAVYDAAERAKREEAEAQGRLVHELRDAIQRNEARCEVREREEGGVGERALFCAALREWAL